MKTITKLILLATSTTLLVSASDYKPYKRNTSNYSSATTSFERGFSTAVHAMERELKLIMSENYLFEIDNKYIVYLNISDMPNEHILIAKNYMIKEGFYPITTSNKLIIDGVDRKADAKHLIKLVKNKYFPNRKVHYTRSTRKVYELHDHIFRDIVKKIKKQKCAGYDKMLNESNSRF